MTFKLGDRVRFRYFAHPDRFSHRMFSSRHIQGAIGTIRGVKQGFKETDLYVVWDPGTYLSQTGTYDPGMLEWALNGVETMVWLL